MQKQLVEHRFEESPWAVTRSAARVEERAVEVPKDLEDCAGFSGRSAAVEKEREHWGVHGADQSQDVEDLGSATGESGVQIF